MQGLPAGVPVRRAVHRPQLAHGSELQLLRAPGRRGLKPSCEIVCPTQAIISGDLDDSDSEVSRLTHTEASYVRAPEQGPEFCLPLVE